MVPAENILETYKTKSGTPERFRRDVAEIVRSYRHSWDVLGELAQNAVDAIQRHARTADKDYEGQISIEIDSEKFEVVVKDNGCGLSPEQIPVALIPSGSFKRLGKDYGYKGYGLTFVCFSSQRFEIETVHDGTRSRVMMQNNIDWLADTKRDDVPKMSWDVAEGYDGMNGTAVRVRLAAGQYEAKFRAIAALDGFFDWAVQLKPLEYVLRTRTAIGCTNSIFGRLERPRVNVRIRVNSKKWFEIPFRYLLPSECEYVKKSYFDDIEEYAKRYADGKLSREVKRFRGIAYTPPAFKVGAYKPFEASSAIVVCGRTGLSKLAEEFGVTESLRDRIKLSTGVHLALHGMPTGITIDDWEGRGSFEQRFFVLVDADLVLSEQLDSGRKGISSYFVTRIVEQVLNHINAKSHGPTNESLRTFSRMMLEPSSSGGVSGDLGEDAQTYVRNRKARPRHELEGLAIPYAPVDENEVIALFFDLVGRGLLPGYRVHYLSQYATYDGAFAFKVSLSENVLHPGHPLGLGDAARARFDEGEKQYHWADTKGTSWFVVEFKPAVQDLVTDRKKRIDEVDVLVAWDADEDKLTTELDASFEKVQPSTRRLFGVTHRLSFEGKECDCILLREVIHKLAARKADR